MKFVALVLLLAVGSQAASLQADAPANPLANLRTAMHSNLDKVKDSIKNILTNFDTTDYKTSKDSIVNYIDTWHAQLKQSLLEAAPYTDSVVMPILEATSAQREAVKANYESLVADLKPKHEDLKKTIFTHLDQYKTIVDPLVKNYQNYLDTQNAEYAAALKQLHEKMNVNLEETKKAMEPIFTSLAAKGGQFLEEAKKQVDPYITEYTEELKKVSGQVEGIKTEDLTDLKTKVEPFVENIKTNLQSIAQMIMGTVNKS